MKGVIVTDTQEGNKAQLGCGTLILIALIVLFFSGRGEVGNLTREVQELRAEVIELRGAIERHSAAHATDGRQEAAEAESGPSEDSADGTDGP